MNHSTATEDPQQDPEPTGLQKRFSEPEKQQQQQAWLGAKTQGKKQNRALEDFVTTNRSEDEQILKHPLNWVHLPLNRLGIYWQLSWHLKAIQSN